MLHNHRMNDSNDSISRKAAKFITDHQLYNLPGVKIVSDKLRKNKKLFTLLTNSSQKFSESFELEIFKKYLKPNYIFIDVGANIGLYSLEASKIIRNENIYSFEPHPYTFSILKNRLEKTKVNLYNMAVSDNNKGAVLFTDEINPGNHSFSKNNLYSGNNKNVVKTTTLDNFVKAQNIKAVNLIKMDIQGAEHLAIKGATKILKENKITLFIEYWPQGIKNTGGNPEEMLQILEKLNFKFKIIDKAKKEVTDTTIEKIIKESKTWLNPTDYTNLLAQN